MVALCLIGIAASWLGLRRLDAWCARQLTDTDCSESEIVNRKS